MAVSRDSIVILHIVRERNCYKSIDNLEDKDKDEHRPIFVPMFSIQVCLTSQLQKPCCQSCQKSSGTISILEICSSVCGSHTAEASSNWGLTMVL